MAIPSLLFDLDGTLVDSVYQHVLAWREALETAGLELSVWRIHRRIGMSGGLFLDALGRETGRRLTPEDVTSIQQAHATAFRRQVSTVRPLPVPWSCSLTCRGPAFTGRSRRAGGSRARGRCWRCWVWRPTFRSS